jgi:hypothetical protein
MNKSMSYLNLNKRFLATWAGTRKQITGEDISADSWRQIAYSMTDSWRQTGASRQLRARHQEAEIRRQKSGGRHQEAAGRQLQADRTRCRQLKAENKRQTSGGR